MVLGFCSILWVGTSIIYSFLPVNAFYWQKWVILKYAKILNIDNIDLCLKLLIVKYRSISNKMYIPTLEKILIDVCSDAVIFYAIQGRVMDTLVENAIKRC